MLIENRESRHAYLVGEVISTKDTDDYFLIQLKHHVWFPEERIAKDITTAVFVRNIEASVETGRPEIPYKDRAKKMNIRKGSRIGIYVRFSGEDYSMANGYAVSYDGITPFKGKNRDGADEKFAIILGTVKSIAERVSSTGNKYTAANVYIGKCPMYDENGNKIPNKYEYRYVTVKTSNEKLMSRFEKALQKNQNGCEKNAAFLCFGEPYTFISQTTGDERSTYTAINFDVMGFYQK